MKHLFVPYELALLAKEKGFDEPCFGFYNLFTDEFCYNSAPSTFSSKDVLQAPLYQQLVDWFRKEFEIYIQVIHYDAGHFEWTIKQGKKFRYPHTTFTSYYEALNSALTKSFELI